MARVRKRSRGCLRGALLVGALLVAAVIAPSQASADSWFQSKTDAQRQTLVNFHYKLSGSRVVPYPIYDEPAQAMLDDLDAELAEGSAYEDVAQSSTMALEGAGFLPFLLRGTTTLNPYLAGIALVAGVVLIQSNDRVLELERPGPPVADYQQINWFRAGTDVYFGARLEQDSWLFGGRLNGQQFLPMRWFEAPCPFTGFVPPALTNVQVRMMIGQPTTASCVVNPEAPINERIFAPVYVTYPWIHPVDLYRLFVNRPYHPAVDGSIGLKVSPRDPGAGAVALSLDQYLEQGGAVDTYKQWLDFQLRVPGVSNPLNPAEFNMPACVGHSWDDCESRLTALAAPMYRNYGLYEEESGVPHGSVQQQAPAQGTLLNANELEANIPHVQIAIRTDLANRQRCDAPYANGRSAPAFMDLAGPGNPVEYQEVPPSAQFVPPIPGAIGHNPWLTKHPDTISLNYGWTNANAGGWGWYHIKMKHGWTPEAVARTQSALSSPDSLEVPQPNGNWAYVRIRDAYQSVSPGSADCVQIVIVDRRTDPLSQPTRRGIVSSFGGDLPGYVVGRFVP